MSRKRKHAGSAPTAPAAPWFDESYTAGRAAFILWRRLVPQLLPAVALGYALGLAAHAVVAGAPQAAWGTVLSPAFLTVLALWLLGSGLGQAWAAALTLLRLAELPADARGASRVLRRAAGRLLAVGAARVVILYGPLLMVGHLAAVLKQHPPSLNPLPMLVLIVASLAVNLATMLGMAAPAALAEPRTSLPTLLATIRDRSQPVYLGLMAWGLLLLVPALLSSLWWVGHSAWVIPNHAIGSYLWVLLAVLYVRARRSAEPAFGPRDLATALGEA